MEQWEQEALAEYYALCQQETEKCEKILSRYCEIGGMVGFNGDGDPEWVEPFEEDRAATNLKRLRKA